LSVPKLIENLNSLWNTDSSTLTVEMWMQIKTCNWSRKNNCTFKDLNAQIIRVCTYTFVYVTMNVINRELYRIAGKCKKSGLLPLLSLTEKRHKSRFLTFTWLLTPTVTRNYLTSPP
jgi:hypothetical protein